METELLGRHMDEKFESGYLREIQRGVYDLSGSGLMEYMSVKPKDLPLHNVGIGGNHLDDGYAPYSKLYRHGDHPDLQFRAGPHERFGDDHINIETISPTSGKSFKHGKQLLNEHIK